MAALPPVPGQFKAIQHYLKTALEHDKRDEVVSYYCRLYALQKAMEIDRKSPEAKQFLIAMMDYLETFKKALPDNEAVHNEVVGQAHVEQYALKLFLYADNEDRAGRFGKNVVKSFYTSGLLMDVLSTFGELAEDLVKNRKYAKWKAAYIHKCLQTGETPVAGPIGGEDEEDEFGMESSGNPGAYSGATGGYSGGSGGYSGGSEYRDPGPPGPSSAPYPTASSYAPPPSAATPPAPQAFSYTQPTPIAAPTGAVSLKPEQFQAAVKYCKHSISALQYEDSATAIELLTKALNLLTTGK